MGAEVARLDNRLRMCAGFVRFGSRLADIGADHAYLCSALCLDGVCPSAIAADINSGPLARAEQTIAGAGLCGRVTTRQSDGLSAIEGDEADDIVIAGMGGELIARIIGDWKYSADPEKRFILQPMTKSESLIPWLRDNGFRITAQDCCEAGGKLYTVIAAEYDGSTGCGELYPYLGELDPLGNELHHRFIEAHIGRLKKQALGDPRRGVTAKKLEDRLYDKDK